MIGSVSCLFNGGFRPVFGIMYDLTSFKLTYATMLVVQAAVLATMSALATTFATYFIWVCIIMLCEGAHFVLLPSVCAKIYGPHMGAKMYAFLVPSYGLGTLSSMVLQKYYIADLGYETMWTMLTIMTLLALVLNCVFFRENS